MPRLINNNIISKFELIQDKGSIKLYKCRNCLQSVTASSSSRLREHVEKCEERPVSRSPTKNRNPAQTKLTQYCDNLNITNATKIQEALCRWIFADNIPFNIVESNFFKDFINLIRPAFTEFLPSRHLISTSMLDNHYNNIKVAVQALIDQSDSICLISDGWSNIRGDSVINFILTTPKPIFYKSIVASNESHTGAFIGSKLCDVIAEIGPDKICGVITDNAPNMKCGWRYIENKYNHIFFVPCIAHSLHLLCKDYVNKIPQIKDITMKSEKIVNYFRNHFRPKFELRTQQIGRYNKTISLKKYLPTRWGTMYEMFHSLLDSKEAIIAVVGFVLENDIREIILDDLNSQCYWIKVSHLCCLFKPIVDSIKMFESDLPCLYQVYPKLIEISKIINDICDNNDYEESLEIKRILKTRIQSMINDTILLASLVDPLNHGKTISNDQFIQIRSFIKEKLQDESEFKILWSEILQYRAKTGVFNNIYIWEDATIVDAITWWKCHGNVAQALQKIAIRVLNIPASSAAAERSWSTMGNIHSDLRNRLTDDRVEKLVYVYQNERVL